MAEFQGTGSLNEKQNFSREIPTNNNNKINDIINQN
jgi:hypothetical protein